ncbi:uncharacterized protein MKZ38_010562 [Zalerion maritima]|uniref:Uncharacterized protein n=1 Tax=Zalerion maritima TaxID=339359 RepID=A0AAD5WSW7_9PEZI|nr:uncharacterized protein MKZ38_010562 [Zalerion maritima]
MQGASSVNQQQPSGPAAGGRLKYANPRDLPSYPSLGLKKSDSAASAAASLGWANQKSPDSPKMDRSPSSISASASAAALLAHDSKMPAANVPSESSTASLKPNASLRAATLAAAGPTQSQRRVRPAPQPKGPSSPILSSNAASQAYNSDRPSPKLVPTLRNSPVQVPEIDRRGSILAASGAMASSPSSPSSARPRAQSSPLTKDSYPDQQNAAANALSAATLAHRPSRREHSDQSGAVPYTTMPRSMFTATPPVKLETDDQKRNDKIHSDALAMARKIYTQQQAMFDAAKKTHDSEGVASPSAGVTSLQDTAYKLAQQRLSKLEGGHQKNSDYQDYYGPQPPTSRRLSTRGVLRRRASSDTDVAVQDRQQSERIQRQMSIFNKNVSEVDEKKRTDDRQALMALAHKNVQTQLAGMDSKITEETGWVLPSSNKNTEWELKAQAAARQRSDERAGTSHKGQVDIGGGKYMDMKAIEEIASKRMKPVLDDINEKAEKEREQIEKEKAEQEAKKKAAEERKAKEKAEKEAQKKQRDHEKQEERERRHKEKQEERGRREKEKQEERARREQQKQEEHQRKEEERAKKEEEKVAKAEQKNQSKDERRRTKELASAAKALKKQQSQHEGPGEDAASDNDRSSVLSSRPSTPMSSHSQQNPTGSPRSPPQGNLKTWLKTRLNRPRGRSNVSATEQDQRDGHGNQSDNSRPSTRESGAGFIGGANLTRSMQSLPSNRSDSMRDVAMAGRDHDFLREGESEIPLNTDRPVSPLSSSGSSSLVDGGNDASDSYNSRSRAENNVSGLSAPPPAPTQKPLGGKQLVGSGMGSGSVPRDSRFQEMMD